MELPKVAPFQWAPTSVDAPGGAWAAAVGGSAAAERNRKRRNAVRRAMQHAWGGYVQYAWGFDELQAKAKNGVNTFGGIGATAFDAADTLLLMGLPEEAKKAADCMAEARFSADSPPLSVFEANIRLLGGALAYFELSGDKRILAKAVAIADELRGAFKQDPTGIPVGLYHVAMKTFGAHAWFTGSILADAGTLSLEWWKLTQHTGDAIYNTTAQRPMEVFRQFTEQTGFGIIPQGWYTEGRPSSSAVGFGASSDSYYEYLLKFWLMTGKVHDAFRDMWVAAVDEMMLTLLKTHESGLVYIAAGARGPDGVISAGSSMEHLTCFMSGALALSAYHGAVVGEKAKLYMQVAEQVGATCYAMYAQQATGLAPDGTNYDGPVPTTGSPVWLMRPEAVESLFVLYRTTGNATYQDWGWNVFRSIEKYARGTAGYHSVQVTDCKGCTPSQALDDEEIFVREGADAGANSTASSAGALSDDFDWSMQTQCSYFLSETLKYIFLLFTPRDYLSLDEWVFNTEGHPLRISSSSGTWGVRLQPAAMQPPH